MIVGNNFMCIAAINLPVISFLSVLGYAWMCI
jgi:hypothetical protein